MHLTVSDILEATAFFCTEVKRELSIIGLLECCSQNFNSRIPTPSELNGDKSRTVYGIRYTRETFPTGICTVAWENSNAIKPVVRIRRLGSSSVFTIYKIFLAFGTSM